MIRNIFFLIFLYCMTSCIYKGNTQTTDQEYIVIADTIINNIVSLNSKYPQLSGIANNETFRTLTKREDRIIINLHFFDSRARGMNNDYYLILDLNFYICKKPGCITTSEKDLSIGDMQVELSIYGKGNDALSDDITAIIKKSKAAFGKKIII